MRPISQSKNQNPILRSLHFSVSLHTLTTFTLIIFNFSLFQWQPFEPNLASSTFPSNPKKVFPRTKKKVPFSFIFVLNSRVSVCLKIFLGLNSCSFQLYCKWVRSHFVSDLLHFVLKFVFLWLFFVGLWLFHVWSRYV